MTEATPQALEVGSAAIDRRRLAGPMLAQVVGQLFARLPVALATVVVNAALLAWVLRQAEVGGRLAAWFAALFALSLARLASWDAHRKHPATAETARRWAAAFTAGAFANGLLWGGSALFFLDGLDLPGRVLLAFLLGGMAAGSAGSTAGYFPAFLAFTVPALAPLTIRLVATGDGTQVAMGAMLLLFGGAVTLIARTSGQALADACHLRAEKEALAARLASARERLEALGREEARHAAEHSHDLEEVVRTRKEAERTLAQAGLQASVGRLAAGVAHEVNSPLACVIGNVQHVDAALAEGAGPDRHAALRQALAEALQGAGRIREIVRSLSTLSRVRPSAAVSADARCALETCLALAGPQLRARACLVLDLAPSPPVVGDPAGLCQVFSEVLLNAAQAIPPGSARDHEVYVSLRHVPEERAVLVELADTGAGVPEADRERVFEPFYSTRRVGEGLGLGLSVAQALVAGWGGRMALGPRLGGGTVVTIWLRASDAPADEG